MHQSTRAVNSGSGNRALVFAIQLHTEVIYTAKQMLLQNKIMAHIFFLFSIILEKTSTECYAD